MINAATRGVTGGIGDPRGDQEEEGPRSRRHAGRGKNKDFGLIPTTHPLSARRPRTERGNRHKRGFWEQKGHGEGGAKGSVEPMSDPEAVAEVGVPACPRRACPPVSQREVAAALAGAAMGGGGFAVAKGAWGAGFASANGAFCDGKGRICGGVVIQNASSRRVCDGSCRFTAALSWQMQICKSFGSAAAKLQQFCHCKHKFGVGGFHHKCKFAAVL